MVSDEYKKIEKEYKQDLMKNMKDISFPRLVGTKDEQKAIDMVKQKYHALGYEPLTENVPCSYYRANFLPIFGNLVGGILLPISVLIYSIQPWLFIFPIFLMLIEIIMMSSGSPAFSQPPNHPKKWQIFNSENIYAESQPTGKLNIIFMGHWDSKSTRLTGFQRVICYLLMLLSSLLLILIGLIGLILYYIPAIEVNNTILMVLWILSIVGIIPAIILSFNVVGNLSPGSCDNATSVANVLQCMKYFKENPIKDVKFTYLLTTAEEIGLTGSFYFADKRKEDPHWSPKNTFVINWDLAGLKGPVIVNSAIGIPKKENAKTLSLFVPIIQKEQEIDVKNIYLPIGGWTDALSFTFFGYEGLTIGSAGAATKVHTAGDSPEIIEPQNLFESFIIGVELAIKLCKMKL
jgi:Peptidase family M28